MKELIENLIWRTGLNNQEFADSVNISASYLSQMKKFKNIDTETLLKWMEIHNLTEINNNDKTVTIKHK